MAQSSDISDWSFNTIISYYPMGSSSQTPELKVTIILDRQPDLVNFFLLTTTIALFTLLGLSVLLTKRDQLANRLLLYLTVFGFSYQLQPSVRALSFAPVFVGFSMIDRILGALVPCTLVFIAFSIIGVVASNGGASQFSWDVLGVFVAAGVLYFTTQFPYTEYIGQAPWVVSATFNLFETGWYGPVSFFALFSGLILKPVLTNPILKIRIHRFTLRITQFFHNA